MNDEIQPNTIICVHEKQSFLEKAEASDILECEYINLANDVGDIIIGDWILAHKRESDLVASKNTRIWDQANKLLKAKKEGKNKIHKLN